MRNSQRGMTLLEAVIAMALVAVIVVALTSALSQSSVFSKRMDLIYTASYLAQQRIDTLKRFDFSEIYPAAEETGIRINSDGLQDPDGDFVRSTEIVTDFDALPGLMKIKVSVDKVKINMNGTKNADPVTGNPVTMGNPVVIETLFADEDPE